eukprot:g127.t1
MKEKTPVRTPTRRRTSPRDKRSSSSEAAPSSTRLEKLLYRVGSWAKRLALIGYIHRTIGNVDMAKIVALYGAATSLSVYRILHDSHSPYGSRRYVMNLAGDDSAVKLIRNHASAIPWKRVASVFRPSTRSWVVKAAKCGAWSLARNRSTLLVFWSYGLLWKLLKRKRGEALARTLFPNGFLGFLGACTRTSGLLLTFGASFWLLLGAWSEYVRFPKDEGLSRRMATIFVSAAALIALPLETNKRWHSLAAFMVMSVID